MRVITVDFISNLPVTDAVSSGVPVGRALRSPGGPGGPVAILHQIRGALRTVRKAQADQRFRAGQFAQLTKLIDAHIIRVEPAPVFVRERDSPIAVANAVLPAILTGIAN